MPLEGREREREREREDLIALSNELQYKRFLSFVDAIRHFNQFQMAKLTSAEPLFVERYIAATLRPLTEGSPSLTLRPSIV